MHRHPSTSRITSRLFFALAIGGLFFAQTPIAASSPHGSFTLAAGFNAGSDIPRKFTCDGKNVSPELHWSGAPAGTKSFALIVEDPDAPGGTFTHWVVFNLRASARSLKQGAIPGHQSGARQGTNGFSRIRYDGPCPPPGPAHRYFFRVYALDTILALPNGALKSTVERAMRGHILARAELMGRYAR